MSIAKPRKNFFKTMKLITLNAWAGRAGEPLSAFLKDQAGKIDIFCFQEVFRTGTVDVSQISEWFTNTPNSNFHLFEDMQKALPGYKAMFCPVYKDVYGIAIFVKDEIQIKEQGEVVLFENNTFPDPDNGDADHTRKMQWQRLSTNGKEFLVANVHGHWTPTKLDDPDRIVQSERILAFLKSFNVLKILCGDFNLQPDTQSITMLEAHMRNWAKEKGVATTRTSLYKKGQNSCVDYIFTSPDVRVADFRVMPDEPSDHTPLFLEFKV